MNDIEKSDLELFEQARRRVQEKNKGRCVRNKDVIVDQEKEIIYYRDKIKELTRIIEGETKNRINYEKELELTIKEEEYLIKYNSDTDAVALTMYINKLINDPDINRIYNDKEFRIYNKTRINKYLEERECYEELERTKLLWQN